MDELRKNLFNLLDEVVDEDKVLTVDRHGKTTVIRAENPSFQLDRLKKRSLVVGDPEDFLHTDCSSLRTSSRYLRQ